VRAVRATAAGSEVACKRVGPAVGCRCQERSAPSPPQLQPAPPGPCNRSAGRSSSSGVPSSHAPHAHAHAKVGGSCPTWLPTAPSLPDPPPAGEFARKQAKEMAKIKQGGLFTSQTSSLSNYDQASHPHAHRMRTACAHRVHTQHPHHICICIHVCICEQEIVRMDLAAAKPPPKKGAAKDEPAKPVNLELSRAQGMSSQEFGVARQCERAAAPRNIGVGLQGREARPGGKAGRQGREARPGGKAGRQGREARPGGKAGRQVLEACSEA
jgi:hypothetical protein